MMRPYVVYVPDELWSLLGAGVDHFEYQTPDADHSVAVFEDGRRVPFESKVTAERIAEERSRSRGPGEVSVFSAEMTFVVDFKNATGCIFNFGLPPDDDDKEV